jgi:hypothetical protein
MDFWGSLGSPRILESPVLSVPKSVKGLLLEHRGVSQHIGQDEVSDLRPAQVHLRKVYKLYKWDSLTLWFFNIAMV